jgi:histidinol-phosphatase (PHP family)
MLTNYHTHTTFCDGKNTPEEIIRYAIDKGFDAIGFSGHGYTPYDLRYCMKDTDTYSTEITRLKEKYRENIQIYLGIEEDAFSPVNRNAFDYVIGSSHYYLLNGKYYPIDSSLDYFKNCLEVFDYNVERMTEEYFGAFCKYILSRNPDIIGHFDLITKFDEKHTDIFLKNPIYTKIVEKYTKVIAADCHIFEANTGAIARGLRTSIYPAENLLKIIKDSDSGLILASDSHTVESLDAHFEETRAYLKDIGFAFVYSLLDGRFQKDYL